MTAVMETMKWIRSSFGLVLLAVRKRIDKFIIIIRFDLNLADACLIISRSLFSLSAISFNFDWQKWSRGKGSETCCQQTDNFISKIRWKNAKENIPHNGDGCQMKSECQTHENRVENVGKTI